LSCLTAILTNSNHQHNGMEGTKQTVNVVWRNDRWLFWDSWRTYIYNVWAERSSSVF